MTALFGPGAPLLLAGSTAASEAKDIAERGGTAEQALVCGLAAGAFEAIFESWSIGNLKAMKEVPVTRLKDAVLNVAKSAGINATEEMTTEAANILVDSLAAGDASNWRQSIEWYMARGKSESEAKKLAAADLAGQVVEAGISGGLMGVGFGGLGSASGIMSNRTGPLQPAKRESNAAGPDLIAQRERILAQLNAQADQLAFDHQFLRGFEGEHADAYGLEGEQPETARTRRELEEAQERLSALNAPLLQAWEEASQEVENLTGEGYNDTAQTEGDRGGKRDLKPQSLMDELARSGFKHNLDEVIMVTKTTEGELLWLEQGNPKSGLTHIIERHSNDFASQDISDIPAFLMDILKSTPVKTGRNSKGRFSDYVFNGNTYRVAYGTNGYVVSFSPLIKGGAYMYKLIEVIEDDVTRFVILEDINTGTIEECFDDSALVSSTNFGFMKIGKEYDCKIKLFGRPAMQGTGQGIVCRVLDREVVIGRREMVEVEAGNARFYIPRKKVSEYLDRESFCFCPTRKDLIQVDSVVHPDLW